MQGQSRLRRITTSHTPKKSKKTSLHAPKNMSNYFLLKFFLYYSIFFFSFYFKYYVINQTFIVSGDNYSNLNIKIAVRTHSITVPLKVYGIRTHSLTVPLKVYGKARCILQDISVFPEKKCKKDKLGQSITFITFLFITIKGLKHISQCNRIYVQKK